MAIISFRPYSRLTPTAGFWVLDPRGLSADLGDGFRPWEPEGNPHDGANWVCRLVAVSRHDETGLVVPTSLDRIRGPKGSGVRAKQGVRRDVVLAGSVPPAQDELASVDCVMMTVRDSSVATKAAS